MHEAPGRVTGTVRGRESGKLAGVGGVAVYLPGMPPGVAAGNADGGTTLRFRAGKMIPAFACVQVNQPLAVIADDDREHLLRVDARQRPPAAALLPAEPRARITERFGEPEEGVRLACDLHPSEEAWVTVVPNRWYAVTAADGTFRLPAGLARGTYTLRAYHKDWGHAVQSFVLGDPADEAAVVIEFPADRDTK
jgi:hypothetical protein